MKSTRDSRKQAPPPPPPAEAIHQHLGSRVKHLRGGRGHPEGGDETGRGRPQRGTRGACGDVDLHLIHTR